LGTAVVFPHARLSGCGHQVAAAARAVLDGGYDRVLAIGVLHGGGRAADAELARSARAGEPQAVRALRRVHGPGAEGDERRWAEEFSLDNFQALLEVAARMAGRRSPALVARFPSLSGTEPWSLPGFDELRRIVREGAALVATADMVHHGAGYGTPPDRRLPREDPATRDAARRWIDAGLTRLVSGDFAGFLDNAHEVQSDFRDGGLVLAALLGASDTAADAGGPRRAAQVEDLVLVNYADVLDVAEPTWVAAALATLAAGGP
jgi:hypothetical protein